MPKHEVAASNGINDLIDLALKEKDYTTHNFLQRYVTGQTEEEKLAGDCDDNLEMIGDDKSGLYLFNRDIMAMEGDKRPR